MGLFNKNTNTGKTWDGKEPGSPTQGIFGSPIYRDHASNDEIVWKYSYNTAKKGAKIFVKPTQKVVLLINNTFVTVIDGGKSFDLFDSANVSLLGNYFKDATGGETPFPVDIWFFNVETHRNMLWASGKLHVRDWETNIPAELYCNGSCIIKIKNVALFYRAFIGTKHTFSLDELYSNLRHIIKEEVVVHIKKKIDKDKIPLYDFQSNLLEISAEIKHMLQTDALDERGVELIQFAIGEVELSEDFMVSIKELRTKEKFYSSDAYLRKEQFEIIKQAASNPGAGITMGMGMGVGMGVGNIIGNMMQNTLNPIAYQQAQPQQNIPPSTQYYAIINGSQLGPLFTNQIQSYIQQRAINNETLVWKAGMPTWILANQVPELVILLNANSNVPPPLPQPPQPPNNT